MRGPGLLGSIEGIVARVRPVRLLMEKSYHRLASHRRRQLTGVTFIAVTGSSGKTTTKELIAAVLSSSIPGTKNLGTHNSSYWVARTILATTSRHRFCVEELGTSGPGSLEAPTRLVQPQVAVVTNVGTEHWSAFRSREAVATEKATIVAALPETGIAVLNADDPLVFAMRERCAAPVITYGLAPGCTVRAEDVAAAWPERLSFTVHVEGRALLVQTRLCGSHWVHVVLAALAVGLAMKIPLEAAVQAIADFPPTPGRFSPESHPDGVTFIRDDYKAPLWSIRTTLDFMREARAERKILVFGSISDSAGSAYRPYRDVAKQALDVADHVIFIGRNAKHSRRARNHPRGENLHSFPNVYEASRYLRALLRPGDLVLLKGSNTSDHLQRLMLARTREVRCWRSACGKKRFCDACWLLGVPQISPHRGPQP